MEMDLTLAIGLMVVIGFFGGCVARKLKFPRITGYIIIGLLLSPSVLNIIPKGTVENLDIITDIALGIIAYCMCLAEAKKTTRFHEINTRRGYYAKDIG
jgi:Kef-type K+ transport system membrane component KefB